MQRITLAHGGGGSESEQLIHILQRELRQQTKWRCLDDDGAVLSVSNWRGKKLVFTSDSFTVSPLFFQGGDIGKLAACGTINDLTVMGAKPIGLSLSLVLEEGLLMSDLVRIIRSLAKQCRRDKTAVVTGDTKVMEKGRLDKLIVNTSGVGLAKRVISDDDLKIGDVICANGALGDHGTVILAHRFNYRTRMKSDCNTFYKEFSAISGYITAAKDPTRGGLAQCLNEMAEKSKVKIVVDEQAGLFRKGSLAVAGLLGISEYSLPSEGRFVFGVSSKNLDVVRKKLARLKSSLVIIGFAQKGRGVSIKTKLGERTLEKPQGKLVPRIC